MTSNQLFAESRANRILLELPDRSDPFRIESEHNGDRLTIMYAPHGASMPPPDDLGALQRLILDVLLDAGRKLTRPKIRAELFRRSHPVNNSHLGDVLSGMMDLHIIRNDHDKRGYYL